MDKPTPIRQHRRYTTRRKANAVGIAMVDGVTQAEKQTGIPKETIQYWVNRPEFAHLRTTAQDVVAEELWVGIQVGVEALTTGLRGDAPLHHKASAFEALANRYALLTGAATSRSESLTGDVDSRAKAKDVLQRATREMAG